MAIKWNGARTTRAVLAGLAPALVTSVLLAAPAALAATATSHPSAGDGWVRLAHLSPNTPAVDVYLYSFRDAKAKIVLDHVSYGTVSPYERLAAGDYTVAMRAAGASPKSKPVLSATINVHSGNAYTVAGMGPASGLRLVVIHDRLRTPRGKALVRVIQASMQENTVTVTAGHKQLALHLRFAKVTIFKVVKPGAVLVRAVGASEHTAERIDLTAGSIHTLVVLDEPNGLAIDDLLDASGSKIDPVGPAPTGLGGTAARPGSPMLPWAAVGVVGLLAVCSGTVMVSRRRRPAMHARQG
jgi:Domain of unknown function (DUF4397)